MKSKLLVSLCVSALLLTACHIPHNGFRYAHGAHKVLETVHHFNDGTYAIMAKDGWYWYFTKPQSDQQSVYRSSSVTVPTGGTWMRDSSPPIDLKEIGVIEQRVEVDQNGNPIENVIQTDVTAPIVSQMNFLIDKKSAL